MHRARRRQCKSWYNDAWRDRLLATLAFLSGEQPNLELSVSSNESIVLDPRPMTFESEVSFSVISKKAIEESRADETADDGDAEDDVDADSIADESDDNEEDDDNDGLASSEDKKS